MIAPARYFPNSLFTRLAALCVLGPFMGHSAPPTPASEVLPDQREVWTPTDHLKQVLAKYPNAVMLSREQYESLIREAGQVRKSAPAAPRRAVLSSANYQARVTGKVAQVTATYTVNVLSDDWAQLPLDFGKLALGAVTVDGDATLLSAQDATPGRASIGSSFLLLRGKGERVVVVDFSAPLDVAKGVSEFEIRPPSAAAGVFHLELPPGQRVESPQPITVKSTPQMTSVTATLSPANPVLALNWRGGGSQALGAQISASGTYTIDAEKVRAEYDLDIHTPLGNLAGAYSMALPADAKVLQVTGEEVADWSIKDSALRFTLQPGERAAAKVRLVTESPSLGAAPKATLTLAVPHFDGIFRSEGSFSIIGDDGVVVKEIATDSSLAPANVGGGVPHWIAAYRFHAPPNSPRVDVEKVRPRFSADLDTRVEFKPEAIFIERTLTVHPEKGEIFEAALTLPAGEELMAVRNPDESEPDWHLQDRKLGLRWVNNDGGAAGRQFKIRTRMEPANWSQIGVDGLPFNLGDMKIKGAERVTGYIALQADDTFRLEAEPSETLERRDGRTTPVQGDYAWFRGADFTLRVKVAKRPGEVLAALTGYALPLEGILDLHAQIDYTFLHSGTRSVRIRVPKEIAANFHFDGPQIAERNLAGNVWTIVFQKELTGSYAMKITGQVAVERTGSVSKPGDGADAGSEKESRFEIAVPVIAPLDVVRTSGVWVIEANTETEITFAAKGMNELDSLLAPGLADYQPRHRVIGVFTWLGADYSLNLSGVRHAAASVLTSVVDQLVLDTVVSASGTERNEATFELRTAGAQYLDVELPENSRLLSLSVNDEAVKPVGDRPEQVRIELPGMTNSNEALEVSVLYETPKTAWRGSGGYSTRAPKLSRMIPILRSQWRLFLPDGFEYTGIDSNLHPPPQESELPLMVGILNGSFLRKQTPGFPLSPAPTSSTTPSLPTARQPFQKLYTAPTGTAESKRSRRGDYSKRGEDMISKAESAMNTHDYETAFKYYKTACDILPNAPLTQQLYNRALQGLCDAGCKLAEQRIAEQQPEAAENILNIVTDDRYNPRCKQAIILLAHLEQPGYYSKSIGPEFRANVERVKQYLVEAQGFFDSGRFDLASKRCDQILAIDKYNIAARKMLEKIDRAKSDYGLVNGETRAEWMKDLDIRWAKPARKFALRNSENANSPDRNARIMKKLEGIIIPKLDFREATLREAIDFLKKKSVELDVNSPRGEKGVNIVLKVDAGGTPTSPAVVPVPGLEPTPVMPPPQSLADARITVSLTNIPLAEALKYVTSLASVKFKVEPYAVFIVPQSVNTDVLITKEYKIRPDLIPRAASVGPDAINGTTGTTVKETARNWLTANGVQFSNPGTSAVYLPGSNRLIVRNTQDQLDLIDTIIESSQGELPDTPWDGRPNRTRNADATVPVRNERLIKKVERIIIPKLEFREATIREVIDFLKKKSVDVDADSPQGEKGVNIVLKLDTGGGTLTAPETTAPSMTPIPGLVPIPGPGVSAPAISPADARITVSLSNIPLIEALKYITSLASLKFKVEPYAVFIVPQSVNTDVLVTKEFRVRRELIPRLWSGWADSTRGQVAIADKETSKSWLISNGVQFNTGASAVYLPGSGRLIVRNAQDQLDLIDTILNSEQHSFAPPEIWKPALEQKLERIVIPKLELRDVSLPEAVEFLRKKSRDVDMDAPVGERGVNIEIDAKAVPEQQPPRITVSLTNASLAETLRYVTSLAGMKFTLTPEGVCIVGASANTGVLITKEWRVRANLFPQTDGIGVAREAARKWLESEGVRFEGEASAVFFAPMGRQKMSLDSNGGSTSSVFLPASGRLVVRNTSEQLDLVAQVLASNNLAEPDDEASKLADSQRISGLLPMKLDLPKIGRMVVLDGLSAADRVEFRYEDWWARARHLWLWFVGGAFVCLFTAGGRPWWRTCWAALALTFFPLVAMASATPICNALLAGWLTSVIIQRVSVRLVFAPRRKEALA